MIKDKWLLKYNLLKEYLSIYKEFPTRNTIYKGIKLGSFVNSLQEVFKYGTIDEEGTRRFRTRVLTKEQFDLLEAIGFGQVKKLTWDEKFRVLEEYMITNKTNYISYDLKYKGVRLGVWASEIRSMYKNGTYTENGIVRHGKLVLTIEQIERLKKINFNFNFNGRDITRTWNFYYELLQKFINIYKRFPKNGEYFETYRLGSWVTKQRLIYLNGQELDGEIHYQADVLSKEEIEKLKQINITWVLKEQNFFGREIKTQGQMEGTRRYLLDKLDLGNIYLGKEEINQELLETVSSFQNTDYDKNWEAHFLEYKKCLQNNEVISLKLKRWLKNQHYIYKLGERKNGIIRYSTGILTPQRIELLKSVGYDVTKSIVWEKEDNWDNHYELFKEYVEKHGTYPLTYDSYKGVNLGNWVNKQRLVYLNGSAMDDGSICYKDIRLTKERILKLNAIGFVWVMDEARLWRKEFTEEKYYLGVKRYLLECLERNGFKSVNDVKVDLQKIIDSPRKIREYKRF